MPDLPEESKNEKSETKKRAPKKRKEAEQTPLAKKELKEEDFIIYFS